MEHHHGQVEDKESVATENGYEVWYSDGYGAQYNETILVVSMEITWGGCQLGRQGQLYGYLPRRAIRCWADRAISRRFPNELTEEIFEHILKKALNNRMVDPGTVFIDGTHIKASANKKKYHKE